MNLKICEDNGILAPIEFGDLPFNPQRIFYITNTPKNTLRGCHAHFKTKQILICIQGTVLVKLYDATKWTEHTLEANQAIYVPNMIWDEQVYLTGSDILLVLCSTAYVASDYISDIKEFERQKI